MPLDLEDVVGSVVADILRRLGMLWASLAVGWSLFVAAVLLVSFAEDLIGGTFLAENYRIDHSDLFLGLVFGGLGAILSTWGLFYVVSMLAFVCTLFKLQDPTAWVPFCGCVIVGLFNLLSWEFYEDAMGWIAFGIWVVWILGLGFLVKLWRVRQRAKAEEHLRTIAFENEQRRREREDEEDSSVKEFASMSPTDSMD